MEFLSCSRFSSKFLVLVSISNHSVLGSIFRLGLFERALKLECTNTSYGSSMMVGGCMSEILIFISLNVLSVLDSLTCLGIMKLKLEDP